MEFVEIFLTLGSICGTFVTIAGFLTLLLKKPRVWIKGIAKETYNEQMEEVTKTLKSIDEKLDTQQGATLCSLRHSITGIYEKYKKTKILPAYTREDLCSLYESYIALGGNSYIKKITSDMLEWEVE